MRIEDLINLKLLNTYEVIEKYNTYVYDITKQVFSIYSFKSDQYIVGLDEDLRDFAIFCFNINYVPLVYIFKKEKEFDEDYIQELNDIQKVPINSLVETKGLSFGNLTMYKKLNKLEIEAESDKEIFIEIKEDKKIIKRLKSSISTIYGMIKRFVPSSSTARAFNIKLLFTNTGKQTIVKAFKVIYEKLPEEYKRF